MTGLTGHSPRPKKRSFNTYESKRLDPRKSRFIAFELNVSAPIAFEDAISYSERQNQIQRGPEPSFWDEFQHMIYMGDYNK